ncbi:alpha/beta hydrolase-fold protein [Nonomuraea sp. NPDC059194]|uniref:alpha/beta hydrolase n=1 Tax=Nonomuraea sp. NPDC059194 TaxID=3346764 RepID=UPI0036CF699C
MRSRGLLAVALASVLVVGSAAAPALADPNWSLVPESGTQPNGDQPNGTQPSGNQPSKNEPHANEPRPNEPVEPVEPDAARQPADPGTAEQPGQPGEVPPQGDPNDQKPANGQDQPPSQQAKPDDTGDPRYSPGQQALKGPARVVRERRLSPRMMDILISSPSTGQMTPVRLLLPRGWSRSAKRTWPVLYLLHGGADNYTAWTRMTDVVSFTENVDAIIVMPEAGRAGNYSDWYNGPAWARFHTQEVRRLLEIGYRAGTRRAIAGLSMGAYGAVKYAAQNPGMFGFVGAFSGIMATELPGIPQIIQNAQLSEGHDPNALWGDPSRNKDVWAANDPLVLAPSLKGTAIYMSSGTNSFLGTLDPPGSPWHPAHLGEPISAYTAKALSRRLDALGIKHTMNMYGNGTHTWPYWNREFKNSFPMALRALGLRGGGDPTVATMRDEREWEYDTPLPPITPPDAVQPGPLPLGVMNWTLQQ